MREHATKWFGAAEVATWSHLRTYRIPYSQPNQVLSHAAGSTLTA